MEKTFENLKNAFAGESQANRRYLAFALKADEEGHPQIAKLFRAADSLRQGVDVALSLRLKRAVQSLSQLQQLHTGLQFLTGELINSGLVGGMVVVGGETATKIYRDLGASGITIRGEVQAGIPAGYWVGGRLNGWPIITKAGGFGRDDTLLRAMEFLRRESRAAE